MESFSIITTPGSLALIRLSFSSKYTNFPRENGICDGVGGGSIVSPHILIPGIPGTGGILLAIASSLSTHIIFL